MMEVLVTIIILLLGLLALVALQGRLQVSEIEAYQRSQAILLLKDMANRLATNRTQSESYVTGITWPVGAGGACPSGTQRYQQDASDWCEALQGAAEVVGTTRVGTMLGGRGCIQRLSAAGAANREYLVTVTWQGMRPQSAPPASVTCGAGAYDGDGTECTGDRCRRYLTTVVRIAGLR
jgi:type IV pilus assembly protein PilV